MMPAVPPTPKWFTAIIIIVLLPLFQFPYLLGICPAESKMRVILWIYPFYVLLSGYLAYQCYPQRKTVAWILIALLLLSHIAIWTLLNLPVQ